jgi:hypothetical protein
VKRSSKKSAERAPRSTTPQHEFLVVNCESGH